MPDALPDGLLAPSFLNALAHCYEGFFSVDANPLADACYLRAAALISRAVAGFRTPSRLESLAGAQAASVLAALPAVRMGIGHALVHVVSPVLGTSHAATHAIVMRVVAHRLAGVQDRRRREELARALGAHAPGAGTTRDADPLVARLTGLLEASGVPLGLVGLGVPWSEVRAALPDIEQSVAHYSGPSPAAATAAALMAEVWSGELGG
ncbi:hypothetical protein [Sinomonas atrocyanea]